MSRILYKLNPSPPARAVMMLAEILGVNMDLRDLNPVAREQDTPEFTKKNPMRTVPILEEDSFCLADSHAIMLYMIEKYGKPQHGYLYPKDLRRRAKVNERLFFDCGVLFPRLRAVMAPTYFGKLTKLSENMKANFDDAYRTLEAYLSEQRYIADDEMTLADLSTVATVSTIHGLHPIRDSYPRLKQWLQVMSDKEFCRKINSPGAEELVTLLTRLMESNSLNQKSKL